MSVNDDVHAYVDGIDPGQRPLFDRVHGLVLALFPAVEVVLSYNMPTYVVGHRRLNVGVWKHGVSLYGWQDTGDAFATAYPELVGEKGTIRIGPADAARIPDADLRALLRGSLAE